MNNAIDTFKPKIDELRTKLELELGAIELNVLGNYTLADAIREGSDVTEQQVGGYGGGERACALSAAVIAAKARGYVS